MTTPAALQVMANVKSLPIHKTKCCEKVFLTFTRVFQIRYIPCCNQMFPLTLVCMVETVELPVFVPLSVFVPLPVQGGWVPVLRPGGSKIFS